MTSVNRMVWEHMLSKPIGHQFNIPQLRTEMKIPGAQYTLFHSSVANLLRKGIVRKATTWNGEIGTFVTYEVIDNTIKPGPIVYGHAGYAKKAPTYSRPTKVPSSGIAAQIIALAAQIGEGNSLRDYSMPELLAEITLRTK